MKHKNNSFSIPMFALAIALAFIFSYIESLIPLPLPFPGIKLGLANIVLVIILYNNDFFTCLGVTFARSILTAITFGNWFLFLYGFTGSSLSILIMWFFFKQKKWSVLTISTLGGIAHNLGQLIVAVVTLGSISIVGYFPVLYFSGMLTGTLIGIVSEQCLKRLTNNRN